MTSKIRNIAIDCRDPYQLAAFWSTVLDRPIHPESAAGDDEVAIPFETGGELFFQRVPEPKAGKNRLHVCLEPEQPRDDEVRRLIGLGARLRSDLRQPDGTGWAVLADPEGNEFCVLRGPADRS